MNNPGNQENQRQPLEAALAHDWLTGMRGGERVLELLCRRFPKAPIYTLIHDPNAVSATINSHQIHTSWLQRMPGIMRHYRHFLPLFSGAAAFAQARRPFHQHQPLRGKRLSPSGSRHLCCATPMRYAWVCPKDYFGRSPCCAADKTLLAALRHWDAANSRVDKFVAISRHVQQRIRDYYGRDADVVYPPVNTEYWTPDPAADQRPRPGRELGEYYLVLSALVPYKRIDIAVKACAKSGKPLRVVGSGTEYENLRKAAGPNIQFLGRLPDDEIRNLYRNCRALLFPGEEDFGLVPLEVQACGRPVMALGRGGALETVRKDVTGLFFATPDPDALNEAVARFESATWDPAAICSHAEAFNIPAFEKAFERCIQECLAKNR